MSFCIHQWISNSAHRLRLERDYYCPDTYRGFVLTGQKARNHTGLDRENTVDDP